MKDNKLDKITNTLYIKYCENFFIKINIISMISISIKYNKNYIFNHKFNHKFLEN